MEVRIHEIREFADNWHRGEWALTRLPEILGLEVDAIPGGGRYLGTTYKNTIILNEDIIGTPIHKPVLAHECGHHMLKHRWIHPCLRCEAQSRGEQRAWHVAALLTIPDQDMQRVITGDLFPSDLARKYDVPKRFVELRYAMALGPDEPMRISVRNAQTDRWITWLAEQADLHCHSYHAAAVARAPASGTK
jgi:hypothetical protein